MLIAIPVSLLLLFLPGAAVLAWQPRRGDPLERLGQALGLSLGFAALIALLGSFLNLHFSRTILWVMFGACGVNLLAGIWWRRVNPGWGWLAALGAFALAAGWRLFQMRGLALPVGVDGVNHTLIVNVLLAQQGLPAMLLPQVNAPLVTPYAFHLQAALLSALSGLPPERAVLVMGQILNAAIALAVYRLGMRVQPDWKIAGLAALLTLLAFRMPAWLLSTSAFGLAAGTTLAFLAAAETLDLVHTPADTDLRPGGVRLALLAAGTVLAHNLSGVLLVILTLVLAIWLVWRAFHRSPLRQVSGALAALTIGVVFALPFLLRTWQASSGKLVAFFLPSLDALQVLFDQTAPWFNRILLLASLPGLVWLWFKPSTRPAAAWLTGAALLALPLAVRSSLFSLEEAGMLLFVPGAMGLAFGINNMSDWLKAQLPHFGMYAPALIVIGLLLYGAILNHQPIDPHDLLADHADAEALHWVREHTPPEAFFLINAIDLGNGFYRGDDGGYWLPALADRAATAPPMLYTHGSPEYIASVNALAAQTSRLMGCDGAFWDVIQSAGVTHIYLREGRGHLQPAAMAQCTGLLQVYSRSGVHIYEVLTDAE